jgi:hypothetical protein
LSLPITRYWYLCSPFFFEKQRWINSLILDFSSICGMVVYKCFIALTNILKSRTLSLHQYLVIGRDKSYFVKSTSKSNNKYKQDEIIQMFDFLIDNIFVLFGARFFNKLLVFQWVRIVFLYIVVRKGKVTIGILKSSRLS